MCGSIAQYLNIYCFVHNSFVSRYSDSYLDFLWLQEVPVGLQITTLHLLVVDLDNVSVVWLHDQGVQMAEYIILKITKERQFVKIYPI